MANLSSDPGAAEDATAPAFVAGADPASASILAPAAALPRQLGLATAAAVIVAEVIGVGIFLTTAGMVKALGSPAWILAVWLVMGIAAIGGALCCGALAARMPREGGIYVYLKEAYGRRVAFLYGWLSMLVTDPGITAAVAVGLATHLAYLVPMTAWARRGAAVAAILALAGVNIAGVRFGSGVVKALAAIKIGVLGFLIVWGFGSLRGDWSHFAPLVERRPGSGPLAAALIGGMIKAFFSVSGWWDVSKIAGEVRDPRRTLPRAMVLGVGAVTVVYILVSAVFLYLVDPRAIDGDAMFATQAGEVLFGRAGGVVLSLIVVVAVLGSLAALLMAMPRVYHALAADGLFFRPIAEIHPRFGTPARATLIQATLASLLAVVVGDFDLILGYFVVPTVLFLGMAVASVFVFRRRDGAGAFPVPWYPLSPVLFLVPTAAVLALLAMGNPRHTGIGLGVVLLGIPAYELLFAGRGGKGKPAEVDAAA
ncbi:Serine/threonine exchanger SteT [Aquisphaera giovannonii]|uniref:Serine/threonine exchanger SteT n=1 Tax=Aquisphaera giovannonii TaxID=406548 RepID=A0A5B9VW83_9BACT|nr:amino acid permease [Aquisphaera giovannonii]QEH31980.1 Serine/threonine exchanger SteT [Aquisphaera giovannonii]